MTWNYAYSPHIWPSLLALLFVLAMTFYSIPRRSVPGALPFLAGCLFSAAWAAGSVMEYAAVDLETKVFWVKFQVACQLPAATTATCFVLEYAWPGRWLTRRNLALLSIAPLLVLGLIFTDPLLHFMWLSFSLDGPVVNSVLNTGSWISLIYSFGLVILSLIVFAWLFLHSPQHRWPVAIMVAGHIGIRTVYVLEKVRLIQTALPLDVIGLAFIIIMYALALFAFRIFDPIPLARQTVIEQLHDGMLVLDPQGHVVSLNPAAERISGVPLKFAQGKPVVELFPDLIGQASFLTGAADPSKPIEMSISLRGEAHSYELDFLPLHDFRRLPVGHLLLLHDVTEQRRSQAQILEQQRALATLKEREHLARELHDSLGQTFAFVNVQGQTIRRLLSRGDIATADEYTQRLVEVAREADVDIRESILGLRVALSEQGFFRVLTQFLTQYEKNYGVRTVLEVPETTQDGVFEPSIEVQLLRILQEALTNVRKHAGADCVRIVFAFENHCASVTVQDNGQGFDPGAWCEDLGKHVGLRVMRERAEEVGGSLSLHSIPGQGTEVVVEVPVNSDQ